MTTVFGDTPAQDTHSGNLIRPKQLVLPISPNNFGQIAAQIDQHIAKYGKKAVIFLEGLEYGINQNGFPSVLRLVQNLKDKIAPSGAYFIATVDPKALSVQEYHLLQKELRDNCSILYAEERAGQSVEHVKREYNSGRSVIGLMRDTKVVNNLYETMKNDNNGSRLFLWTTNQSLEKLALNA